jgi:integrative and conjugative element protein (TIGR02256 family)
MVQWFKRHPDFLRSESTALSNDSNYKEIFQSRDNLFVSHGNIIVRLNKTYKFPILIVYPDSTPYSLPDVYPLKRVLDKAEVDELSKMHHLEIFKTINADIEFYYHLRHQNASGNLCIIEWESLDSGSQFYGITSILQRVRDWYAGHITGVYPTDSQEVDFCSHFNFINKELTLIYPSEFLNESLVEGDAYAALSNIVPKNRYTETERYIYTGFMLDGLSKSGLVESIQSNPESHILDEKLKTSADYQLYPEIVNRLINEKKLLKACWFHVNQEPKPFQKIDELIEIIGNGDREAGIKRFAARCAQYIGKDPDNFMLGIRFPNRKGVLEFLLFKIYKKDNPPLIDLAPENKIASILARYEKVEAIENEKITKDSYHQRNSTRADYNVLKTKEVNILGVGALGSEIADSLGKAGIGGLLLVDNQTLKAHNSVRHLAGMEYIGESKVRAVASILSNHNPYIHISGSPFNLYWLHPTRNLSLDSISISSVADDNLEGYISEQMVISNRVCFYARALRGGKVARIFRVIPGKDACFQCLNLYRNSGKEFIDIPDDEAYPTLKNECNNPIRPASAADLKLIAALASSIFIEYLQGNQSEINHWIWSTEKIEGTAIQESFHVIRQQIPVHPKCFYCNHERKLSVSIGKGEVALMQKLLSEDPTIETGGVLAGRKDDNGNIVITHASGPGPKAVKSRTKFEKDIEYCQQFLDKLYLDSNQQIVYIGEWHSHPSEDNRPSGQDIESLSGIANQKEYLTVEPVSIILSNSGGLSCTVHPAGKLYYHTDLNIIN